MTALNTFSSPEYLKFAELQGAVEKQIRALFSHDKATFQKEEPSRFSVTRTEGESSSLSVELANDLRSIRFKIDDTSGVSHFRIDKTNEGEISLSYGTNKISVAEAVDELLASFLLDGFFKSRWSSSLSDRWGRS